MNKLLNTLLLTFFSIIVFAQNQKINLSGVVTDADTKLPLSNASVFVKNTTIGTTTNNEGYFKLNVAAGGYDLVITYIGYQTKEMLCEVKSDKEIKIVLNQVSKELEAIILSSMPVAKNGWLVYGDFFLQNFLGSTDNSKSCEILNKDVVKFYYIKSRNCLKVIAREPIEIKNKNLSYLVKYTLDSFVYDYNKELTTYTGYPFFLDLQKMDTTENAIIKTNRLNAYEGSMLHFMRSTYSKTLKENGFELRINTIVNKKIKVIPIFDYYETLGYKKNDTSLQVRILPKQSTIIVKYLKGKPEKAYLNTNPGAPSKYQLSVLNFVPNEIITIEKNGFYYKQQTIFKSEYYSWKRIGDLLPYDYTEK